MLECYEGGPLRGCLMDHFRTQVTLQKWDFIMVLLCGNSLRVLPALHWESALDPPAWARGQENPQRVPSQAAVFWASIIWDVRV